MGINAAHNERLPMPDHSVEMPTLSESAEFDVHGATMHEAHMDGADPHSISADRLEHKPGDGPGRTASVESVTGFHVRSSAVHAGQKLKHRIRSIRDTIQHAAEAVVQEETQPEPTHWQWERNLLHCSPEVSANEGGAGAVRLRATPSVIKTLPQAHSRLKSGPVEKMNHENAWQVRQMCLTATSLLFSRELSQDVIDTVQLRDIIAVGTLTSKTVMFHRLTTSSLSLRSRRMGLVDSFETAKAEDSDKAKKLQKELGDSSQVSVISHRGMIWKQGHFHKAYKERLMVLDHGILKYYRVDDLVVEGDDHNNSISAPRGELSCQGAVAKEVYWSYT